MNYPVLAIEPRGFTQMLPSADYWSVLPLGFVAIYRKRLGDMVFYAKDGTKWQLNRIAPAESVGTIHRVFGGLKPVQVLVEFRLAGGYRVEELRTALKSAVEADDDILCQYHAKEQILVWLEQAQSIAKIFNLYNWVTKEYVRRKRPTAKR